MNIKLGASVQVYGGQVVDFWVLYEFRLLLKKKVAEFKGMIGKSPSVDDSMHIPRSALGLAPKQRR